MRFEGFVGNEQVKSQLSSYFSRGRFPHVLVIEGEDGLGKRTLAKILAKAILCLENEKQDGSLDVPCLKCTSCLKVDSGNHPDIRFEGGDGSAKSFHIDVVRDIKENIYVLPNDSKFSVVIMSNAHAMTPQAQNALLKILEEPPKHAYFILTCQRKAQLLETIQSRAFFVGLGEGGVDLDLAANTISAKAEVSYDDAKEAAVIFNGNIGKALEALKEGDFKEVVSLLPRFAKAIVSNNDLDLLKLSGKLEKDKLLADSVISGLIPLFRDVLVYRNGGNKTVTALSLAPDTAKELSRKITSDKAMKVIYTLEGLQRARLRNMNYNLFLTVFCSRLRNPKG